MLGTWRESGDFNKRAFRIDWELSRLPGKWVIPSSTPAEIEAKRRLYDYLEGLYPVLRREFKRVCSLKGGDPFSLSWLAFSAMVGSWGIADTSSASAAAPKTARISLAVSCMVEQH